MTEILSIICTAAILWRGIVAAGVAYNRIKTRGVSPTLNIIFWDWNILNWLQQIYIITLVYYP